MKTEQIPQLTSLRFFAAASIVFFHLQGYIIGGLDVRFATGVSFFFVLSGFILSHSYRDFSTRSIGDFYFGRFARIWPVHAVTFVLIIVLVQPYEFDFTSAALAGINLTLLQSWLPLNGTTLSFNGLSWSISAEMAFYAVFPVLARSRHFYLWYAALAALAFSIVLTMQIANPAQGSGVWGLNPISVILQHPAVRCIEFATGMLAWRLHDRLRASSTIAWTVAELAAVAVVAAFLLTSHMIEACLHSVDLLRRWYSQAGGMFSFALAIATFAHGRGAISAGLRWRPLVLLGKISFSTYMIHEIVIRAAMKYGLPGLIGVRGSVALILAAVYILSYLLWALVETRAQRALMTRRRHSLLIPSPA
ncbi:acyltransferase [Mesorhizobium sp. AR07]|uniref:acyltransferase family protein n=1 Tax=Mesorhizobium sp. AR07 TaxID=2865838 RepID=UPI0021605D8C|nr:acyltransferase [Mesorhizobium sp. AR07]UVK45699.1 acyltransferase [Mesorhizobium sp. AR07]